MSSQKARSQRAGKNNLAVGILLKADSAHADAPRVYAGAVLMGVVYYEHISVSVVGYAVMSRTAYFLSVSHKYGIAPVLFKGTHGTCGNRVAHCV